MLLGPDEGDNPALRDKDDVENVLQTTIEPNIGVAEWQGQYLDLRRWHQRVGNSFPKARIELETLQ